MVKAMKKNIIISIVIMVIYAIVWLGMGWYANHFEFWPVWYVMLGAILAGAFMLGLEVFIMNLWLYFKLGDPK